VVDLFVDLLLQVFFGVHTTIPCVFANVEAVAIIFAVAVSVAEFSEVVTFELFAVTVARFTDWVFFMEICFSSSVFSPAVIGTNLVLVAFVLVGSQSSAHFEDIAACSILRYLSHCVFFEVRVTNAGCCHLHCGDKIRRDLM
jgi:hypothetical protein